MKIVIIGYSGSGKSTLAKILGKHYNIPVLHLDSVNFKPGWEMRPKEEFNQIVHDFMNVNSSWVIEGNYHKVANDRFELADQIIFLNYNRFTCLNGVLKRYKCYKGKSRPDMAEGCEEKIDFEFVKWVLFEGRTKQRRNRLKNYALNHLNGIIFKNRKQLKKYCLLNNINI